jgi:hypothetical protein
MILVGLSDGEEVRSIVMVVPIRYGFRCQREMGCNATDISGVGMIDSE